MTRLSRLQRRELGRAGAARAAEERVDQRQPERERLLRAWWTRATACRRVRDTPDDA